MSTVLYNLITVMTLRCLNHNFCTIKKGWKYLKYKAES